jgi:hypothetical protein
VARLGLNVSVGGVQVVSEWRLDIVIESAKNAAWVAYGRAKVNKAKAAHRAALKTAQRECTNQGTVVAVVHHALSEAGILN